MKYKLTERAIAVFLSVFMFFGMAPTLAENASDFDASDISISEKDDTSFTASVCNGYPEDPGSENEVNGAEACENYNSVGYGECEEGTDPDCCDYYGTNDCECEKITEPEHCEHYGTNDCECGELIDDCKRCQICCECFEYCNCEYSDCECCDCEYCDCGFDMFFIMSSGVLVNISVGEGGRVQAGSLEIWGQGNASLPVTPPDTVSFIAIPAMPGYTVNWSISAGVALSGNDNDLERSIVWPTEGIIPPDVEVNVTFGAPIQYSVTFGFADANHVNRGSLSATADPPDAISWTPLLEELNEGQPFGNANPFSNVPITFTATPSSGFRIGNWSIEGGGSLTPAAPATGSTVVTSTGRTGPINVRVSFIEISFGLYPTTGTINSRTGAGATVTTGPAQSSTAIGDITIGNITATNNIPLNAFNVSVEQENITVSAVPGNIPVDGLNGTLTIPITRENITRNFTVEVNIPRITLTLVPNEITIIDSNLSGTVNVEGTAENEITSAPPPDFPSGFSVDIDQSDETITVTGARPAWYQAAIGSAQAYATFNIPVSRDGVTTPLTVLANLTPIDPPLITFEPGDGGSVTTTTAPLRVTTVGIQSGTIDLISLPIPTHTNPDLTFMGWYTTLDPGGVEVTLATPFSDTATVYARWGQPEISISPLSHEFRVRESVGSYSYAVFGYEVGIGNDQVQPLTVSVLNASPDFPTGAITVEFTNLVYNNYFTISTLTLPSIPVGADTREFTVAPVPGLGVADSPYSATVRVFVPGSHPNSSHNLTLTFRVDPAPPIVNWPTSLSAVFGDTLADIALPAHTGNASFTDGTFSWTAVITTPVGAAGTQQHNLTFTPTDSGNFATIDRDIPVIVERAPITNPAVTVAAPLNQGQTPATEAFPHPTDENRFSVEMLVHWHYEATPSSNDWQAVTDTFTAGVRYRVTITIIADANHLFPSPPANFEIDFPKINGEPADVTSIVTSNTESVLTLQFLFPETLHYAITLTEPIFDSAEWGYPIQDWQCITITNIGNQNTGPLLATIDNNVFIFENSTSGSIINEISPIPPNNTATLRVRPTTGLPVGNHQATVTVSPTTNSSNPMDPQTLVITFTVTQATPSINLPDPPLSATFGQTLADVDITDLFAYFGDETNQVAGAFTWENPNSPVGSVADSPVYHDITFTPDGYPTGNYRPVSRSVPVEVNRADIPYIAKQEMFVRFSVTESQTLELLPLLPANYSDWDYVESTITIAPTSLALQDIFAQVPQINDHILSFSLKSDLVYHNQTASFTITVHSPNHNDRTFDVEIIVIESYPLTITGVTAINREFDGTTSVVLSDSAAILQGTQPGDDVRFVFGGAVGTLDYPNVGENLPVIVSGITLDGTDASNYFLIQPTDVTVNITPRVLTITPDSGQSKVFGTADPVPLTTFTADRPITVGDYSTGFTGALSRESGENVGNYAFTLDTLSAGSNYTLNLADGHYFEITRRPIIVTGATAADKEYDRLRDATVTGVTFGPVTGNQDSGLVDGDTLDIGVDFTATGLFDTPSRGDGKSVDVTVTLGDTPTARNYYILPTHNTATASANITARTLTITGIVAADRVFDGTNVVAIAGGDLQNVLSGDTVTVNVPTTGTIPDRNIGNGREVTIGTITLDGTDSGNYILTQPTGITVSITERPLTITPDSGQNKVFDTDDPSLTFITPPTNALADINGYSTALTGALSRVSGENVGNYAFTLGTLSAGPNYTLQLLAVGNYFAITPAPPPTIEWPSASAITFGSQLSESTLSGGSTQLGGFAWTSSDAVPDVSRDSSNVPQEQPHSVTFTPSAPHNINFNWASLPEWDSGSGTLTNDVSLMVTPATLVGADIIHTPGPFEFYNTQHLPAVISVVTAGNLTIDAADFTGQIDVSHGDNTNAGTGSITVTAHPTGNFTGSATALFDIAPRPITAVQGTLAVSKVFDGTTSPAVPAGSPDVTDSVFAADNTVSITATPGPFPNINVGTNHTVTVALALSGAGAGNYTLSPSSLTITNAAITPAPEITDLIATVNVPFNQETLGNSVNLAELLPGNRGFTTFQAPSVSPSSHDPFVQDESVTTTGTLTFNTSDATAVGIGSATITIAVNMQNYEQSTITVTVNFTALEIPIVTPTVTGEIYFGQPLRTLTLTATAQTAGGTPVPGSITWNDPNLTPSAGPSAQAWTFVPANTTAFITVTGNEQITVRQTTPTGTPLYTPITAAGSTLEDVVLSPPSAGFRNPWSALLSPVIGILEWYLPDDTCVAENTSYAWTFTPFDLENYTELTGNITPWSPSPEPPAPPGPDPQPYPAPEPTPFGAARITSITPTAATIAAASNIPAQGMTIDATFEVLGSDLTREAILSEGAFSVTSFPAWIPPPHNMSITFIDSQRAIINLTLNVLSNNAVSRQGEIILGNVITPSVTGTLRVSQVSSVFQVSILNSPPGNTFPVGQTVALRHYLPGDIVELVSGTKYGYSFAGWSTDSAGVEIHDEESTISWFVMPPNDVVLTANWTPREEVHVIITEAAITYDYPDYYDDIAPYTPDDERDDYIAAPDDTTGGFVAWLTRNAWWILLIIAAILAYVTWRYIQYNKQKKEE